MLATRKTISKFDSEWSLSPKIYSSGQEGSVNERGSLSGKILVSVDIRISVEEFGSSIRLPRPLLDRYWSTHIMALNF
jgi:hypothetical protein